MEHAFGASRVTVIDHPLVQHKLTILRGKDTSSKDFRELNENACILPCLGDAGDRIFGTI